MSTTQPAPALPAVSPTEVFQFVRQTREFLSINEFRAMLKNNLGYDSRQVFVSASRSREHVTLTVHDTDVDLGRVKTFAKALSTWTMDQGAASGQSVAVETTRDVDTKHAAAFIDEAASIAFELTQPGQVKRASNGATVISQGFDLIVQIGTSDRWNFGGSRDAAISKSSHQLALAIARA